MSVLLFTESTYVRKSFVNALIPNGISVFHTGKVENIPSLIEKKGAEIIVYDVIQENYDEVFKIMDKVKQDQLKFQKRIGQILIIANVERKLAMLALQKGAVGFIKSNADEAFIAKYIAEIHQKIKGVPPQRKFVRISLDTTLESERIAVKFRSPINMQLIMGIIRDISAGGIAVELVGTFDENAIEVGQSIKNVQFILDGKDVMVDVVVVAYKKRFCAFRFDNPAKTDQDIISHFIFEKLSLIN